MHDARAVFVSATHESLFPMLWRCSSAVLCCSFHVIHVIVLSRTEWVDLLYQPTM